MEKSLFALSLGLAGLLAAPTPAPAQPQCAAHDAIAVELAAKYGEARQSMGLAADATVMELYASLETGTWTLTVTLPDGVTCLVAAGSNFQTVSVQEPAKGNPA